MATLKKSEILESAKKNVLNGLVETLDSLGAERYGSPYQMAIPTTVDGIEVWVKVDLTTANYADTKVSKAFDPFEKAQEWEAERKIKADAKAVRDAEKAAKVAKAKEKA